MESLNNLYDAQAFKSWMLTNPKVKAWRKQFIEEYGEEPQIEDSGYDYVGAWQSGIEPEPNPDHILKSGEPAYHWGSIGAEGQDLKAEDHPTRWKSDFMKKTGWNPDSMGISERQAESLLNTIGGR